jgi:hypothetical protein
MENKAFKSFDTGDFFGFSCTIGDWSVSSHDKTFQLNNHGIKLVARYDEDLVRVEFDTDALRCVFMWQTQCCRPNARESLT